MDLTLRHILERYGNDTEILKHVLAAKVEEDKKIAAQDTLKIEQARIQLRELDLELMREHGKATVQYHEKQQATTTPAPLGSAFPTSLSIQPTTTTTESVVPSPSTSFPSYGSSSFPPILSTPYHGLPPVQQQVLARITSKGSGNTEPYPHSAHPLCQTSDQHNYRRNRLYPSQQPTTPISPGGTTDEVAIRKRGRSLVNELSENGGNKKSHVQVMEALKAKIQRSNSSMQINDTMTNRINNNTNKRGRTSGAQIFKADIDRDSIVPPSTPSPRSAKPTLPHIDTSVGCRRPSTTITLNTNNYQEQHVDNNSRYRLTSPVERSLQESLERSENPGSGKDQETEAYSSSSSSSKEISTT